MWISLNDERNHNVFGKLEAEIQKRFGEEMEFILPIHLIEMRTFCFIAPRCAKVVGCQSMCIYIYMKMGERV